MRRLVHQADEAPAAREDAGSVVGQDILDRIAELAELIELVLVDAEPQSVSTLRQLLRRLALVAQDEGLLLLVQLLDEVGTEIEVEIADERGAGPGDGRVFHQELALPF